MRALAVGVMLSFLLRYVHVPIVIPIMLSLFLRREEGENKRHRSDLKEPVKK